MERSTERSMLQLNRSSIEVCPNVCVEPTLHLLTGGSFTLRSTNTEEGARLDIKAQNFWE